MTKLALRLAKARDGLSFRECKRWLSNRFVAPLSAQKNRLIFHGKIKRLR